MRVRACVCVCRCVCVCMPVFVVRHSSSRKVGQAGKVLNEVNGSSYVPTLRCTKVIKARG